jgi:microcystin-dependent protein
MASKNDKIGTISIFAGNRIPSGWLPCDGDLLPKSRFNLLFLKISNRYGGDGITSFAVPDMRGRMPSFEGAYFLSYKGGSEQITLEDADIPKHNHLLNCDTISEGEINNPTNSTFAKSANSLRKCYSKTYSKEMAADIIEEIGNGVSHNNMQPYQVLRYIICAEGEF